MRNAASTACSSKGLSTGGKSDVDITLYVFWSILNLAGGASGSGTCFTQTIMFMNFHLKE
jgi:hypothetical protein